MPSFFKVSHIKKPTAQRLQLLNLDASVSLRAVTKAKGATTRIITPQAVFPRVPATNLLGACKEIQLLSAVPAVGRQVRALEEDTLHVQAAFIYKFPLPPSRAGPPQAQAASSHLRSLLLQVATPRRRQGIIPALRAGLPHRDRRHRSSRGIHSKTSS